MAAQTTYQYASGTTQAVPLPASAQMLATSPPLGGVNITVDSPTAGQQNETSIAVNTNNPSNLIGGSNDYRTGDSRCGRYVSTNNGSTWTDLTPFAMFTDPSYSNNVATNIAFTAAGDPGTAFDANGHAYYLCMYFTRTQGLANSGDATQYVHKSDDGGATWGPPIRVSTAAAGSNFDDKGHMAVDNKSSTAYRGNIYVAWARLNTGEIHFARSTDGGVSFEPDYAVGGLGGSGANIAVGIDGTVYLASISGTTISIASSTNGGQSFGAPNTVRTLTGATGNGTVRPLSRTNSFPVIGTSPTNANNVYAVWSEKGIGNDDSDIMFARSTNGGVAWGTPVRVNDDVNPVNDWNSQFFPWMAVDPTDGEINIVWYDDRLDPNHTDSTPLIDLFFASSTDDGLSFGVNTRVSTQSSNTNVGFSPQFFGDYNAIAAFNGVAYPLWADSRTGDQDVLTTQIGGADLAITKSASSNTVAAGTEFTFTIGVTNGGPASAFNVVVTDTLPTGLTYVSSTDTCTAVAGTVTCKLGNIASGSSTSFDIQVSVDATVAAGSTLTNTATVKSDQQDPVASNNTASASVIVTAQADLQLTKTCKPDQTAAQAGSTAFCTIAVFNAGPSTAQNVQVTDNIFASTPFTVTSVLTSPSVACTAPGGATTSGTVSCAFGSLASGGTATVTVNFSANSGGDINDTAMVTATTPDPNTANNSATGKVTFVSSADVSITKVSSPNPVVAGTNLTYTISVGNVGPSTATNVVVKDTLPGQVSMVSTTPSAGSCTGGIPGNPLQPLTCTLGSLANGGSATITVVVTVAPNTPSGTILVNNATVASDVADPNNANNSSTAFTNVSTSANLAIVKTSDKSVYKPSSIVTYTITVTNNGPSDALAVLVTDNLPALKQATYKSDTGGCSRNATPPTVLTCSLGTVPTGTSKSFNIYELINGNQGLVSNTASVAGSTPDPNLTNNTSTRTVTIGH